MILNIIRYGMIIQLKQLHYKGDKSLLYIFVLFILVECAKIVISKCLGFGIIVGSVLGKIVNIHCMYFIVILL